MDQEAEKRAAQQSASEALTPDPAAKRDAFVDVRLDKVEKLKKAIADGSYTVSAENVARKLIEHMLEPKE